VSADDGRSRLILGNSVSKSAFLSDHPELSVDGDLQALELVRVVEETHREAVIKADLDLVVADHVTSVDNGVEELEEARVGPPASLPFGDALVATMQFDSRLHSEVDRPQSELEIEGADAELRRELPNRRRQVEVSWNSIQSSVFLQLEDTARHIAQTSCSSWWL
jgi:hypothetical protein